LLLVGTGSRTAQLKDQVRRLGIESSVEWRDWTDDPGALLRQADIYALSSDYEGWGRVLIEAMAYAVPIVTTDVGCAGEVVKDGVHGYVVPVRDETAFANALSRLVADRQLRERYGKQARRDVRKTHVTLAAYATAWREVLETTRQLARRRG
jgi:glycosyltransferase involved in cell wall biosynthesis